MASYLLVVVQLVLYLSTRSQALSYGYGSGSVNLVNNSDFEDEISSSDWVMKSADGTKVNDSNTGSSALLVTNRRYMTSGPTQKIYGLKKNTNYYMSAFVKLVNNLTKSNALPYVQVRGIVKRLVPPNTSTNSTGVSRLPFALADGKFHQMGGDFKTADEDFSYYEIFFRVYNTAIDYIIDSVTLVEVPYDPDWKNKTNYLIEQNRKSPVTIVGSIPSEYDLADTTIKITMTRHAFGFGTAVVGSRFRKNSEENTKYRQFVEDHFTWAVLENAIKWKKMEGHQGTVKYADIDAAMTFLEDRNFIIRGHTLFWSVKTSNPSWTYDLYGEDMVDAMENRINYTMNHLSGRVAQWDVANEHQQERFFEAQTGDLTIMEQMFRSVHSRDPTTKIYFNDYLLLRSGLAISPQLSMIEDYLSKGIPVHGLGAQTHLRFLPVDPEIFKQRLDLLSTAGVPIVVTELSVHSDNVTERKVALDLAMRIAFSNPVVEAIVIWGFSDLISQFSDDFTLTEGEDFTPNEAGQQLLHLIHNEWNTTENIQLDNADFKETLSAFHGNYTLTVINNGQVVHSQDFNCDKGSNTVQLTL